jgi:predicted transcriptional regulator
MAQTSTLTIRLPEESMNRLDLLAKETAHSRADIAAKAVEQYLDVQDWHVRAIQDALEEADSPDARFLDHEEVVSRLKKAGKI